jgi:hypothetical protein
MPAKDIGAQQLVSHSFLAGIDNVKARIHGRNLLTVAGFDRIAENDAKSGHHFSG